MPDPIAQPAAGQPAAGQPVQAPNQQQQQPQQQPPQPSPQQTDMAHHALLGKAVSALMGGSTTNYSVDPETGQTVATKQKMSPGQWGRSMILGAMLGLSAGSSGDAKGGAVGGFLGGLGRGSAAVTQHNEQQDAQKRQQAQEQFKNQLEAQRNQREQDEAGRQKQAFQTEETHKQAVIAHENIQTLREQQLMRGESFVEFERSADRGKAKLSPYVASGIQPVAQDKTDNDMQAILAGNPKAVGWDWEQTGVKTVMVEDKNGKRVPDYVPTFDAYDPKTNVTLTQSYMDLMKKAKIDDQFPGTTDRLKVGQKLTPAEFATLKDQYQKTYNTNMEMEKARLQAGNLTAEMKLKQAEAVAAAARAGKDVEAGKALGSKTQPMFSKAMDAWTDAGPGIEGFAKLDQKSQWVIQQSLPRLIAGEEKIIHDAKSELPPDDDRANLHSRTLSYYNQMSDFATAGMASQLPKAPKQNAPIPDAVMTQYLKTYPDPQRAQQAASQAGWGPPAQPAPPPAQAEADDPQIQPPM